jgi:predicted ArsR family transcriptional regulator
MLLMYVMNKRKFDDEVMDVLRSVIRCTAYGYQWDIIEGLSKSKSGMSTIAIAKMLGLSSQHVYRMVGAMTAIKIVEKRLSRSGSRGAPTEMVHLSDELKFLMGEMK